MHRALVGQTPAFKHLHSHGVQQMSRVANAAELAPFLLSDKSFNALWDEQGPEKQQRHGVSSQEVLFLPFDRCSHAHRYCAPLV